MTWTITGADERIQPVADPSEQWRDAVSFTAWDAGSGLFLLVRLAVLPNRPAATGGVLAWIGARPVYAYGHTVDEVPLADWDDLTVHGLRVREVEALRSWEVDLGDGDNGLSLRWDGFSGVVGTGAQEYVQACRVTGRLALNGHAVRVEGMGERQHLWGVPATEGLVERHVVSAFLGVARALHVVEERTVDGQRSVRGMVHDGEDRLVTEVARTTTLGSDGAPAAVDLVVTVEGGRTFTVRGTGHGTAVASPAESGGPGVVHQRLVRFETDDGLDGYGRYELLSNQP